MAEMKLPYALDLTGKVAVVTGAAGVLCSDFSRALAKCGAKVALLDINETVAKQIADEIVSDGGQAIAVKANCLDKASLEEAKAIVDKSFGPCDILINGAGGNNPRATTFDETFSEATLADPDKQSFFSISPDGVRFVFDLNVTAAFLTTQVFALDMAKSGMVSGSPSQPAKVAPCFSGTSGDSVGLPNASRRRANSSPSSI